MLIRKDKRGYRAPTTASRAAKAKWRAKMGDEEYSRYLRAQHLRRNYGMTLEDEAVMLAQQEHKCAVCSARLFPKEHHIDHCHKTGKVRGALCRRCNRAIGLLQDDPAILRQAITYLGVDA